MQHPTSYHRSSLWLALLPRGSAPGGRLALRGVPAECLAFLPQGHIGWDAEVTQCLDVWTLFQAEDLLCCPRLRWFWITLSSSCLVKAEMWVVLALFI